MPSCATWRKPSSDKTKHPGVTWALKLHRCPSWTSDLIPKCEAIAKTTGQRCRCPALQNHNLCRNHNRLTPEELIAQHPGPLVRKKSKPASHILAKRAEKPSLYFSQNAHRLNELPIKVRKEMHRLSASWQGRILKAWDDRQMNGVGAFYKLWDAAQPYLDRYPYKPK